MALFFAAISRDLVSLLRFPFLTHIQIFSLNISLVCRFKCPYHCFSSYFCFLFIFVLLMLFLSVLVLVALISLPSRFFMESSSRCINASTPSWTLANLLPLSFLDIIVCLRHSSWVFLFSDLFVEVLLSPTLIIVPRIIRRGQPRCLFLSWDFCCEFGFEQSSLSPKVSFFYFFFHLHLFDGVHFQYSQVFVTFLFIERFDFSLIW